MHGSEPYTSNTCTLRPTSSVLRWALTWPAPGAASNCCLKLEFAKPCLGSETAAVLASGDIQGSTKTPQVEPSRRGVGLSGEYISFMVQPETLKPNPWDI